MRKVTLVFVCFCVLLSGCSQTPTIDVSVASSEVSEVINTDNTTISSSDVSSKSFPKNYYENFGDVVFSIEEIDSPSEMTFYSGKPVKCKYRTDDLIKHFIGDRNYTVKEEPWGKDYYIDDGELYGNYEGRIEIILLDEWYYGNSVCDDAKEGNLFLYSKKQDFEFGTAEESIEKIKSLFKEYGLNLDDDCFEYVCYYLDYKTLEANELYIGNDGNPDYSQYKSEWSEKDNAYQIYVYEKCQGCRDYHDGGMLGRGVDDGSNACFTVRVNSSGMEIRQNRQVYTYELDSEPTEMLDFSVIADNASEFLKKSGWYNSYRVTGATLFIDHMVVDGEMRLTPVWAFTIWGESEDAGEVQLEIKINGLTGKFIDYNGL